MKKLLSAFIAVLICTAVGGYFRSPSKAQRLTINAPTEELKRATFMTLIDAARQTGTTRVIVGLQENFRPIASLPPAELAQRKLAIREIQNDFLNRFEFARVSNLKQFEYIPFLAFETDAKSLELMQNDSQISSVQEDVADALTLAESTAVVGAPTAWASGYSGSGWTVAVLDTGVDKNHIFLNGKVVSEACYSSNGTNVVSFCPGGVTDSTAAGSGVNCDPAITGCPHGTHVAGIVAGTGASFNGVAKDAKILAVQVFSRFNSATDCGTSPAPCSLSYTSDQIKGLERVLTLSGSMNIASVNMSLGGGQNTSYCDAAQAARKAAIDNLRAVNVATVISSGNSGYTNAMGAPACISSAVSVGSTGDGSSGATLDAVSSFSNSASFLNLLAPGQWINSSVAATGSNSTFQNYSGTSMAAPHVAASWAILKQRDPNASVSRILDALTSTGQSITDARNNITKPRIRIANALNALSTNSTEFDFDGDGKADVSVFRPSNGTWYLSRSQTGFAGFAFGLGTDKLAPADYDGDGKTDLTVYRNGTWYIQKSTTGFTGIAFGASEDVPVPADYDGDGKADVAVFRPSNGTWYRLNSSDNQPFGKQFGQNGDIPTLGDFDGDGKADVALFRPSTGYWYRINSSSGAWSSILFGATGDKPVPADFDGDGKTDIAVFRPSNGTWYIQRSQLGTTGVAFGLGTDLPSPADYDGDGKTDVAVFRNGTWYIQKSSSGFTGVTFGAANDLPVPNMFIH